MPRALPPPAEVGEQVAHVGERHGVIRLFVEHPPEQGKRLVLPPEVPEHVDGIIQCDIGKQRIVRPEFDNFFEFGKRLLFAAELCECVADAVAGGEIFRIRGPDLPVGLDRFRVLTFLKQGIAAFFPFPGIRHGVLYRRRHDSHGVYGYRGTSR